MSDKLLQALVQLFAIVAGTEGGIANARTIVNNYLRNLLSKELTTHYMMEFEKFYAEYAHKPEEESQTKSKKKTSLNSVKILRICSQINSELTHTQKFIVIIRLFELVSSENKCGSQELEFITTVASVFKLAEDEFIRCLEFVSQGIDSAPRSSNIALIDKPEKLENYQGKSIGVAGLNGQIRILRIGSVNLYFFRLMSHTELSVNGLEVVANRIYILNAGACLKNNKISPIYYSDIIQKFRDNIDNETTEILVQNIEYKFNDENYGLHNLSFKAETGNLIGIMGASGSGKSTLLNIMTGNYKPTSGKIIINGLDLHAEKHRIKELIGYVPQDDLLIEDLSVYENLYYNARLIFGNESKLMIRKKVIKTLKSLGLYEIRRLKIGNSLNKKISGGQRKRLNIALEIIREPSVLFLDEPTSGLSSRDSENIIDLLKDLTLKGKIVFVVIHQPSSDVFKSFDQLLIIDTGGYPVYHGNPLNSLTYFKSEIQHIHDGTVECSECGNVNPDQLFNIIEAKLPDEYGNPTPQRKVSPTEWNQKFRSIYMDFLNVNSEKEFSKTDIARNKKPTRFQQIKIFMKRDVLSKISNLQYLIINFGEAPALALILATLIRYVNTESGVYVYGENENIPAYIFMSVVVALFIGLSVSAEEIFRDRKILKREEFLNLSRSSYLSSKTIILFVISAIQALSFVAIGNYILEIKDMNADYFFIFFSTACFANMLGLNISAAFNSAVTIYILIPFIIIPQLILSGVIVKFEKLNPNFASAEIVPLTGELMASRWAYEALAVNQFKKNKFESNTFDLNAELSESGYRKNYWIPELQKRIDNLEWSGIHSNPDSEMLNNVQFILGEIIREADENKHQTPLFIDSMNSGVLHPHHLELCTKYLQDLRAYHVGKYNKAQLEKEKMIMLLQGNIGDNESLNTFQKLHVNEYLSDMVKNKNELNKIIESNGKLIRNTDQIYFTSDYSKIGRAQFYAPFKNFFSFRVETYWANAAVLWTMTILLFGALYYGLLPKYLSASSRFCFRIVCYTRKQRIKPQLQEAGT